MEFTNIEVDGLKTGNFDYLIINFIFEILLFLVTQ